MEKNDVATSASLAPTCRNSQDDIKNLPMAEAAKDHGSGHVCSHGKHPSPTLDV